MKIEIKFKSNIFVTTICFKTLCIPLFKHLVDLGLLGQKYKVEASA